MGRRSKVDLYGLVDRVVDLYHNQKKTQKEIEKILREEGYDISRESIRVSLKNSAEVAEHYLRAVEESKALVQAIKENPNTDMVEAVSALMTRQIFEFMKSVDELQFEDSEALARAINNMASAQVRISKYKLDYEKGYEKAKADVLQLVRERLKERPDVVQIIKALINEVRPDV